MLVLTCSNAALISPKAEPTPEEKTGPEPEATAEAEATPEEYREKGRFKIGSHGRPSWAHPVVAGGRLYLRDQEWLGVYDIRAEK